MRLEPQQTETFPIVAILIRDIKVADDGAIWILTENGGRLYRLSRRKTGPANLPDIGKRTGEQIYFAVCSSCHSQKVPGAPQFGVRNDWIEPLEKGNKVLYRNTLRGINGMPEKGLCEDCTKRELRSALNYLIRQVEP